MSGLTHDIGSFDQWVLHGLQAANHAVGQGAVSAGKWMAHTVAQDAASKAQAYARAQDPVMRYALGFNPADDIYGRHYGLGRLNPPGTQVARAPLAVAGHPLVGAHSQPTPGKLAMPASGGLYGGYTGGPPAQGHNAPTVVAPTRAVAHVIAAPSPAATTHASGAPAGVPHVAGSSHGSVHPSGVVGSIHTQASAAPAAAHQYAPWEIQPGGKDLISQMIAGQLQQSQRLTDTYNTQTGAMQDQTTQNAAKLAADAGSLGSYSPIAYAQAADANTASQMNPYTDLVNKVGASQAGSTAAFNQAQIADQGNAIQQLFGSDRAAAGAQNIEYAKQLAAREPGMRNDLAIAMSQMALNQAKGQFYGGRNATAQYGDQLRASTANTQSGVQDSYNQGRLALDAKRIANTHTDNMAKLGLQGFTANRAQVAGLQAYVNKHLMGTAYTNDKLGARVASNPTEQPQPYSKTMTDLLNAQYDPQMAAAVAIRYDNGAIKAGGSMPFYNYLIAAGVKPRAAIRFVGQQFGSTGSRQVLAGRNQNQQPVAP